MSFLRAGLLFWGLHVELDFIPYRFDPRRVLPLALGAIPSSIVSENQLVPIGVTNGCIVIAVAEMPDEGDFEVCELFYKIRFVCNREIELVVVTHEALQYARTRYLLGGRE